MGKIPLKRLALVVGGGPAPGINGVISAVTIEAANNDVEVFGVMDGFKWLIDPKTSELNRLREERIVRPLGIADVKNFILRGGSILRTSRANPTKNPEDMERVLKIIRQLEIDALVTIGGDDTAYSASRVHAHAGGKIRVAHVPKTIDNDLPLQGSTPTFGFETARQVGTGIVRALAEDARTTSRWYIVVSMGRAAGHLALGIGKSAAATLTIIPEEFRERKVTLDEVCDIIISSILKRTAFNRQHGVVVLAEGLLEAIGAEELQRIFGDGLARYGKITVDPHGHFRLGEIDFARMIKHQLSKRLKEYDLQVTFIDKEIGYELRSADPIPFDAAYTRDLGYGAVKFLSSAESEKYGAIISYVEGRMVPLPFEKMINPGTKRMRTRKVDVDGEAFQCALRYMIRVEKRDFEDPERLQLIATTAKKTPDEFRRRFEYLVR